MLGNELEKSFIAVIVCRRQQIFPRHRHNLLYNVIYKAQHSQTANQAVSK